MNLRSLYGTLQNIFTQPRKVFALALVLGIFCSASYVLFLSDIYRDTAYVYAVFARAFGNGNFSEAIATKVPMLNIVLSAVLVFFGVEAAQALTIVAGIFYLAACFPLRSLLERYVSPLAAAWGCVLYISAPKMIRFACAPLLESSRIFCLLTAVLYFLRNTDEPKVKNAVLFGVSAGLIAVSRGEGLVVTFALLGAYLFYVKFFGRQVAWKKQFATWVIALFCCFVSVSPFCAMNYSKSGYFVTDMRMVEVVEKLTGSAKQDPLSLTTPRWSSGYVSEHDARVWRIKHGFACLIRGGYELFWVFAILGGVLIIRQKRWKSDYWVFIGIAFSIAPI